MPWEIRPATPRDASGVSRVYTSTVERWWRALPGGEQVDAHPAELSTYERFLNGGPWMDPEPCARHLQDVLDSGQWPLVAVDDAGRIVGEVEVIVGPDSDWGFTAHVDVLQVDRGSQRKGVGSAFLGEVRRRATSAGCSTLTTNPEEAAIPFYGKCGLTRVLARQTEITVPTSADEGEAAAATPTNPVSDFRALGERRLVLGRLHTSFATWIKGQWLVPGLTDRGIREEGSIADSGAHYRIRQSFLSDESAKAYAWADRSVRASGILRSLLRRARQMGFVSLETTVDVGDLKECVGPSRKIGEESLLLGCRLDRRTS